MLVNDKPIDDLNIVELRELLRQERAYSRMLEIDQQHRIDRAVSNASAVQQSGAAIEGTVVSLDRKLITHIDHVLQSSMEPLIERSIPEKYRGLVTIDPRDVSRPSVHIDAHNMHHTIRLTFHEPKTFSLQFNTGYTI